MVQRKPSFLPIKTKRTFEEIADQIREAIYSGIFKPGDKLPPERELAVQFRTGRMVVREALRVLEQSGLIYIKHGSMGGAFIKDIDTAVITRSISEMVRTGKVTVRDLTEARLEIEKVILEFIIKRVTPEDLDLLAKNIETTREMVSKGNRTREKNIEFHLLLARFSRNPLFEMIVESTIMSVVGSFLEKFRQKNEYWENVLCYHEKIYQAIKNKNLSAAKQALEKHLLDVNRRFLKTKAK